MNEINPKAKKPRVDLYAWIAEMARMSPTMTFERGRTIKDTKTRVNVTLFGRTYECVIDDEAPRDIVDELNTAALKILTVDPERIKSTVVPDTGIFVRARVNKLGEGRWDNYDISQLDRDSLRTWLRVKNNAEAVVVSMLGHKQCD